MTASEPKRREFGFGCRETPDVTNKFLEELGYYRKHVATDSSSLFRVVSELQYDIQLYHPKIRLECVKFMRSNRGIFTKEISYAFESYVNNLYRSRTYGSLVELKALALRYRANVFLFEPLTQGRWFVFNKKYKATWRIYLGRDNHFDVVYPLEEIKVIAECQAIVYQVLYEDVLGLPDVEYAVERMLHDREGKRMRYKTDEDGTTTTAITPDGLEIALCKEPGNTQCALMYSHLCHFHNEYSFDFIEDFFIRNGLEEGCRVYVGEFFHQRPSKSNPLLTDPHLSCVRQLLALGITPFPYKAAKSLDPCIYRNVEYDVWQEVRRARITHILENEKRKQNEKYAKRGRAVNPCALAYKKLGIPEIVGRYAAHEQTDGTVAAFESVKQVEQFGGVNSPIQLTSYQGMHIPPSEQFAINTVGIITSEPNHLTYTDSAACPAGVQNCMFHPYCASTPLPMYHTTTAQTPLKHFQSSPILPANTVTDLITVVPHQANQPMSNEYVMLLDSPLQSQQQQRCHYQAPQQHLQPDYDQQQQNSYQHQRHRRHHRQQQYQQNQQQQSYQQQQQYQQQYQQLEQQYQQYYTPRCLLFCYPNEEDTNNRTPPPLTYDNNSYTVLQSHPVFHAGVPYN